VNHTEVSALIEEAYTNYADAIFRHCYFRLFQREKAKELMQETFLKALQYLQKGNTVENLRAFLYTTANHLIIDFVRKKSETSLDALLEDGFDPTGAGDTGAEASLEHQQMQKILSSLERDERQLITMRYIDELKPQEMANILNLSPNVISVRLHRAMLQLKKLLKQP
jgi:RNA polymerase sigma-70 factor, ECF subfamily